MTIDTKVTPQAENIEFVNNKGVYGTKTDATVQAVAVVTDTDNLEIGTTQMPLRLYSAGEAPKVYTVNGVTPVESTIVLDTNFAANLAAAKGVTTDNLFTELTKDNIVLGIGNSLFGFKNNIYHSLANIPTNEDVARYGDGQLDVVLKVNDKKAYVETTAGKQIIAHTGNFAELASATPVVFNNDVVLSWLDKFGVKKEMFVLDSNNEIHIGTDDPSITISLNNAIKEAVLVNDTALKGTKTDGSLLNLIQLNTGNDVIVGSFGTDTSIYSENNPTVTVGSSLRKYEIYHKGNRPYTYGTSLPDASTVSEGDVFFLYT